MDVTTLEIGMVLANYRALANLLGEPIKGGASKKYQLQEWERYFSFSLQGHKITITKIYKVPQEKIDGRVKGGKSKWFDTIAPEFLDFCVEEYKLFGESTLYFTRLDIMEGIGLCNEYYRQGRSANPDTHCNIGIPEWEYTDFFNMTDKCFNSVVDQLLINLRNQYVINFYEEYKIRFGNTKQLEICSPELLEYIRDVHYKTLRTFNRVYGDKDKVIKTERDIWLKKLNGKFYLRINKILKRHKNIIKWYKLYKVILGEDIEDRANTFRALSTKSNTDKRQVNALAHKSRAESIHIRLKNIEKKKDKIAKGELPENSYISDLNYSSVWHTEYMADNYIAIEEEIYE